MAADGFKVDAPGGFFGIGAIGFGAVGDVATAVTATAPLPVAATVIGATSAPLTGSASASGAAGPFVPQLGRAIRVALWGSWTGTVQLLRSIDGGTTRLPITYPDGSARGSWSTTVNARIADESEAGASYYLAITLSSGALSYRVSQ